MKRLSATASALTVVILLALLVACTPAAQPAAPTQAPQPTAASTEPTAAPAKPTDASVAPGPQGTLRLAISGEPNSLYIPLTADKNADIAASQLYDPLVFQNEKGEIEPALAESWEVSDDGCVYTFKLRQGVTFHNGEPFTADDVIATWEYGKSEDSAWPDRYSMVANVEKVDEYTVKVSTDGPKPLLLATMHDFWSIIPNEYMAEVGVDGFQEHPIGTGPFMFEEWVKGDHITYKANPNYWREGLPKVAEIVFRPIPDSATRVAAIQADEIDLVQRLSAEEAESLQNVDGVTVISYPVSRIFYIAFNNLTTGKGLPTEDPKVRQAMNYAVDVDAIIDALFGGHGRRAAGYVASSELGFGVVKPFPYDPEKAKQLLAEAGYPNGFEIDMAGPAGAYGSFEEVLQAIAGYLGEVGIKVNLEIMESGQYWDLQAKKELPPLFGDSWSDESGEAYTRIKGALGGWDAPYSAWSDPEIDRLIEGIASTVDIEARKALYEELQVYMQENPPFIYLYEPMAFEAIRDRVVDYVPRSCEMYYVMATSLKPGE